MPRIAIDLTPLLPGGDNGAAKLLVLELLSQFKTLPHPFHFILLTSDWNHQELAAFDGPGFQRLCILHERPSETSPDLSMRNDLLNRNLLRLRQILPEQVVNLFLPVARMLKKKWGNFLKKSHSPKLYDDLLQNQEVSLLFCPFTAPIYAETSIPVVSIVYDLQHRTYPQFFSLQELSGRDTTLDQVRRQVDSIICISEFSRRTLVSHYKIKPEKIFVVPVCIHSRLNQRIPDPFNIKDFFLPNRPYLFYPANFWPHKNHKMLLTAYSILNHRHPDLDLDLVFTGALLQPEKELKEAVEIMGIKEKVHFLGYLTDDDLAVVFQRCQYLIFPSLYEGFGVPLLEAFSFGKPVLCSQVGSLPEIGGAAAYYFDPRNPLEIVEAIEHLLNDSAMENKLIQRGYEQVSKFNEEKMALRYLEIFNQTLDNNGVSFKN